MKKSVLSLLIIIVVVGCAFAFTACSNATTQGQLEDIWQNYERYVYSVVHGDLTGEYTVTVEHKKAGASFSFGETGTLEGLKEGYLVSGELVMGDSRYVTQCYFELINGSDYLRPKRTYRHEINAGVDTLTVNGSYDGDTLNYTMTQNGAPSSGSVSSKSPFYDNNEIHQTLRGVSTLGTNFSFAFNMPVIGKEISSLSMTAACSKTVGVTTEYVPDGEESALTTECYEVTLSRTTEVKGIHHTLYYAVNDISVNGWPLKKVLTKFIEPTNVPDDAVVYTLKSISLLKD